MFRFGRDKGIWSIHMYSGFSSSSVRSMSGLRCGFPLLLDARNGRGRVGKRSRQRAVASMRFTAMQVGRFARCKCRPF